MASYNGLPCVEMDCMPQQPSKLPGLRLAGARPQTHRYLQDSVLKLGEDSVRGIHTPLSPLKGSDVQGSLMSKSGSSDLQGPAAAADMWRHAFNSEAMECVRAMKAVVDKADVPTFSVSFDDWRKTDLKATAQVQQHVKELLRLNTSLEDFLADCSSMSNLTNFKNSFLRLSQCVDELAAINTSLAANVDSIAKEASTQVVSAWQKEVHAAREQQRQQWMADSARWSELKNRMDGLQQGFGEVNKTVVSQTIRLDGLEAAQRESVEQLATSLTQSAHDMRAQSDLKLQELAHDSHKTAKASLEDFKTHVSNVFLGNTGVKGSLDSLDRRLNEWESEFARKSAEQLSGHVKNSNDHSLNSFKEHINNVFIGSGGVAGQLGELQKRMTEWERLTNTDLASQREAARQNHEQAARLEELAESARKQQAQTEEALHTTAETLNGKLALVEADLHQTQASLKSATDASLQSCMKRLRQLDTQGSVKVNLHTGAVQVAPIEFVAVKPGDEAPAAFADEAAAGLVLADVVALFTMFEGPVAVEVHLKPGKGGKPDFWQRVVDSQAELVRCQLVALGAPIERLTMASASNPKGANAVVVRLDKDLFPEDVAAAKAPAKRGKSPGKK